MTVTVRFRLLACSVILPLLAGAQVKDHEMDRRYTPNANSIFNNLLRKPNEKVAADFKNSIKICPTMLIRQKAILFYERTLNDPITLHIGIGKAFGEDFFQDVGLSLGSFDDNDVLDPSVMVLNSDYYDSGVLLSAGARIYFNETAFEEGYIDFFYRRESMSYRMASKQNGIRVEGSTIAEFRMSAFYFGFGYGWVGGSNSNFTHDIYFNFGLKQFSVPKYVKNQSANGEQYYRRSSETISVRLLPALNVGYIFGIGF
jgi:hypothetical protein